MTLPGPPSGQHRDDAESVEPLLPFLDQILADAEHGREYRPRGAPPGLAREAELIGRQVQRLLRAGASLWDHAAADGQGDDTDPEDTHLQPRLAAPIGVVDEYELLSELGKGGFGVVYRARHRGLGQIVAVKLLRTDRPVDPLLLERTLREWRAIGKLAHPNIIRALDARMVQGAPLLVTEFVEGEDLSRVIQRLGAVPSPLACEIVHQLADALRFAHEQGIVHRDVKPHNVLYQEHTGVARLLDFGLARLRDAEAADGDSLTMPGAAMGTTAYMAPEQWADARSVGPAADVYSLGCTFYHLIAGKVPFPQTDPRSRCIAHATQPPPPCPGAPPEIERLIHSMMAKAPQQRPTLHDVLRRLDAYSVGPLVDLVPKLIETLESALVAGMLADQLTSITPLLPRLSPRRVHQLFADAGRRLGPRKGLSGVERGLTALQSLYIELDQYDKAYEVGLDVIREIPDCPDARHFAAVAALHVVPTPQRTEEFLIQEVIRLESEAQALPAAQNWSGLGPSLSTLAQAHHKLWRVHQRRGETAQAAAQLRLTLQTFERRLQARGRSAIAHALYAEALRDAQEFPKSFEQASKALAIEWFCREAQELCLDLVSRGAATLPAWDEHLRRWSTVAGEWPNTRPHQTAVSRYLVWLEQRELLPELLFQLTETRSPRAARFEALCREAARAPREVTWSGTGVRFASSLSIWQFPRTTVVGIPAVGLFSQGTAYEPAEASLSQMLFALNRVLNAGQWRRPPYLEKVRSWLTAHTY